MACENPDPVIGVHDVEEALEARVSNRPGPAPGSPGTCWTTDRWLTGHVPLPGAHVGRAQGQAEPFLIVPGGGHGMLPLPHYRGQGQERNGKNCQEELDGTGVLSR